MVHTIFIICVSALILSAAFIIPSFPILRLGTAVSRKTSMMAAQFSETINSPVDRLKFQIIQLGAALDRGQQYNPTSGSQYYFASEVARSKIAELVASQIKEKTVPPILQDLEGEWELVYTTVPHGIFRSSPFFLAIQEAYTKYGGVKGFEKAQLFFKLHELQTCSWGVSKVGRVAQYINSTAGILTSEFDTSIFSLTVIPFVGFGKLLPTFGGCVITVSNITSFDASSGELALEVDYTTAKEVQGLQPLPFGLGINTKVPVAKAWKLLNGRPATATVWLRYIDTDMRVMQDSDGEYFVYTRPVVSRSS